MIKADGRPPRRAWVRYALLHIVFCGTVLPAAAQSRLDSFEAGLSRAPAAEDTAARRTAGTPVAASAAEDEDGGWLDLLLSALRLGLAVPAAVAEKTGDPGLGKDLGFDLRAGLGVDQGDVGHLYAEGRASLFRGLGFSAGYLGYFEDRNGVVDHLDFTRLDARYQFGSTRNSAGLELGGRWMRGGLVDRSGLDGAVTLDVSPVDLLHFDVAWRVSRLGANTIREFNGGAAATWMGFGLRVGYRNLDNGVAHIEGPEFGLGYSF